MSEFLFHTGPYGRAIKIDENGRLLATGDAQISGFPYTFGNTGRALTVDDNSRLRININTMPYMYTIIAAATIWVSMPNALSEILGNDNRRIGIDLSFVTKFRILTDVTVVGSSNAVLGVQYSTDNGSSWRGLDNGILDASSTVTVNLSNTGSKISNWTDININALSDVLIRIVGSDGNGISSPSITLFALQFK